MEWDSIVKDFKTQITDFATDNFNEYKTELLSDGQDFITASKEKILRWTTQLGLKQITEEEFKSLAAGLQDTLKLEALKKVGQAQIKAYELKQGLTNILISSVLKNL